MFKFLITYIVMLTSFTSLVAENQLTLSEFLQSTHENYESNISTQQNQWQPVHFVMGNESADLDSIMSSIAYAYLLSNEETGLYVPLLNLPREELALRKDILHHFAQLNISIENLLFLDDNVPLDLLFSQDKLRLNLVDHNILRPRQEHLSSAVERIVDHHAEENKQYPLLTDKNKLIAVVGSNSTLIAEKLISSPNIQMTAELATLLLGPILIDTSNLKSLEKTTDRDLQAAELLKAYNSETLPKNFFEELLAAKNDVSGLTPVMLLSKDFKEYLDGQLLYGISSMPTGICWWIEDESEVHQMLEKYASDRQLAILILLMVNPESSGPKRKIIMYSPSPVLLKAFDLYIQETKALSDALTKGPQSNNEQIGYYTATKFISRKQLQPLLRFSQ